MAQIQVAKTQPPQTAREFEHNEKCQAMETAITDFLHRLGVPNDVFDPAASFNALLTYAMTYDRILYSTISNYIYAQYESKETFDALGTILSNLEVLVAYSENPTNIVAKRQTLPKNIKESAVDDARKMVLKIWDHVTLASHQYTMLKQTDDEYDEKFKQRISSYKEEMSKEMNTQMITMVGVFTALAFLIFGSISSLDGIFENIQMPLFKTMSIGLIWGLCVSNMIFVFLYCIGKMTHLNFKANDSLKATIFERYPVVWWTNLVLIALLLISSWGWFIQQNKIGHVLIEALNYNPWCSFWIGSIAIILLLALGIFALAKKTKFKETD